MSRRRPGTVRRHGALLCAEGAAASELARALNAAQESIIAPLEAYEASVVAREAHVVDRRSYAAELEACAEKMEAATLDAAALALKCEHLARGSSALLDALIALQGCVVRKAAELGADINAPPGSRPLTREALLEDARARANGRNPSMN